MIATIGEALVDIIGSEVCPGGSLFNCALAAKRLGCDTVFLDNISSDKYGKLLYKSIKDNGIIVPETFLDDPRPTMYSEATIKADGSADYEFEYEGSATLGLDSGKILGALKELRDLRAVEIGSVSLALEPSGTAILDAIEDYKDIHPEVNVLLDPNVRPALIKDKKKFIDMMYRATDIADLVKLSDEDLAFIMDGNTDPKEFQIRFGNIAFVLTRGKDGCTYFDKKGKAISVPASKVKVADTVGAGDTFSGVLLFNWDKLDGRIDEKILSFASKAAAFTCSKVGCDPPRLEELL